MTIEYLKEWNKRFGLGFNDVTLGAIMRQVKNAKESAGPPVVTLPSNVTREAFIELVQVAFGGFGAVEDTRVVSSSKKDLAGQLAKALADEDYEEAARIRDAMAMLEADPGDLQLKESPRDIVHPNMRIVVPISGGSCVVGNHAADKFTMKFNNEIYHLTVDDIMSISRALVKVFDNNQT